MTSPRPHAISTARPAASNNVGDIDNYERSIRPDAFGLAARVLEHLESRVIDLETEREQ